MKIIKGIFIALGIIFALIILIAVVLVIVKPYGINVIKSVPVLLQEEPASTYDHPGLSTKQEAVLEAAGLDLEEIPTEISPAQQDCAVALLGKERVDELAAGSAPTPLEILKLKKCLGD